MSWHSLTAGSMRSLKGLWVAEGWKIKPASDSESMDADSEAPDGDAQGAADDACCDSMLGIAP